MASKAAREWLSRPENDGRIMTAWERFVAGEGVPPHALRRLIDDSWQRCQQAHVDPSLHKAPPPLETDELGALRKQHERLLAASTPQIALARDLLARTGTTMILTDPEGTILEIEGDRRIFAPSEEVGLVPGFQWTEMATGTNAIGTALALGQPVQIHAAEHFCAGIKQWTCAATVIRDPLDSSILGAIDVSGLIRSYSRHSLALAVSTADRIESRLARLEMERRFRLLERCMAKLASSSDGVMVFDRRGNLVKASDKASFALATLGIPFKLEPTSRIAALNAEAASVQRQALPEWLRPDWIEPVVESGDRLGTIVSIPAPRLRALPSLRATEGEKADRGFERILGNSPPLREAVQKAQHLARSHVPVLLLGETGVGKEWFARGIHDGGQNREGPFVALNCGGLSRELLASELFGYAEGAFTGARRGGMIGKIEAANGGTLFLDEIGEMPMDLQPHFLRVLEEGEIYRLGENIPRKVNFRLLAATNRNLRTGVTEGKFRMDLFYRIAVTSIRIPPLRERREDIRLLVEHMLSSLAERHGIASASVEDGSVIEALKRYDWPGNVRELRNVVEGMLLMATEGKITLADLPPEVRDASISSQGDSIPLTGTLESAEQVQIRNAIQSSHGNLTLAAKTLGIAKSTLYLKLKKYGMEDCFQSTRGDA